MLRGWILTGWILSVWGLFLNDSSFTDQVISAQMLMSQLIIRWCARFEGVFDSQACIYDSFSYIALALLEALHSSRLAVLIWISRILQAAWGLCKSLINLHHADACSTAFDSWPACGSPTRSEWRMDLLWGEVYGVPIGTRVVRFW